MRTYEYRCIECGHEFEKQFSMASQPGIWPCNLCRGTSRKLISKGVLFTVNTQADIARSQLFPGMGIKEQIEQQKADAALYEKRHANDPDTLIHDIDSIPKEFTANVLQEAGILGST